MEKFKNLLINALMIAGIISACAFAYNSFFGKSEKTPLMYDTAYVRLIKENAEIKAKAEIYRFERDRLDMEIQDLKQKETVIINNNTQYKKDYPKKTPSETDAEYLNLFKKELR